MAKAQVSIRCGHFYSTLYFYLWKMMRKKLFIVKCFLTSTSFCQLCKVVPWTSNKKKFMGVVIIQKIQFIANTNSHNINYILKVLKCISKHDILDGIVNLYTLNISVEKVQISLYCRILLVTYNLDWKFILDWTITKS